VTVTEETHPTSTRVVLRTPTWLTAALTLLLVPSFLLIGISAKTLLWGGLNCVMPIADSCNQWPDAPVVGRWGFVALLFVVIIIIGILALMMIERLMRPAGSMIIGSKLSLACFGVGPVGPAWAGVYYYLGK
jgi:hypothetical protein